MSTTDAPWYLQPLGDERFAAERDELTADASLADAVPHRCALHRSYPDDDGFCHVDHGDACETDLDARRRRRAELARG